MSSHSISGTPEDDGKGLAPVQVDMELGTKDSGKNEKSTKEDVHEEEDDFFE